VHCRPYLVFHVNSVHAVCNTVYDGVSVITSNSQRLQELACVLVV